MKSFLQKFKLDHFIAERILFVIAAFMVPMEGFFSGAYQADSPENILNRGIVSGIGLAYLILSFSHSGFQQYIRRFAYSIIYVFILQISYLCYAHGFTFDYVLLLMTCFLLCSIYFRGHTSLIVYLLLSMAIMVTALLLTPDPAVPVNTFLIRKVILIFAAYGLARIHQIQRIKLFQANRALAKRNRELSKITYAASHELKTPVRAISNLSTWMQEDLEDELPPETQEKLAMLSDRAVRMHEVIDGILSYARAGTREPTWTNTDLNVLLRQILEQLALPVHFKVELPRPLPVVVMDPQFMQEVMSHLVENACKYNDKPHAWLRISWEAVGDFYDIHFKDNGPGIAPMFHEKVFEIFQTLGAPEEKQNRGLGLALVKKILLDSGGNISLTSQPGKGATFTIRIPKKQ